MEWCNANPNAEYWQSQNRRGIKVTNRDSWRDGQAIQTGGRWQPLFMELESQGVPGLLGAHFENTILNHENMSIHHFCIITFKWESTLKHVSICTTIMSNTEFTKMMVFFAVWMQQTPMHVYSEASLLSSMGLNTFEFDGTSYHVSVHRTAA